MFRLFVNRMMAIEIRKPHHKQFGKEKPNLFSTALREMSIKKAIIYAIDENTDSFLVFSMPILLYVKLVSKAVPL